MILSNAMSGRLFYVVELGLPNEISRRLEALGMIKGSLVKVLRKKKRGAMIITVRGTRFALGLSIAEHILVKEAV
ncbi:MAG: ferrous iron transport protein A [Acutalibacter sp.]|jgi:ferrous iron transport protein A|uniref:FeoA family protein n=1 Tax=Acutalibacter sp. TaxID=1918636 RepID=UPI00137303E5|nr:FeoA family protein [Acutalibacter sp.]MCI9224012.1 ferrous iron transport protein A [Acutalibacter sp.]